MSKRVYEQPVLEVFRIVTDDLLYDSSDKEDYDPSAGEWIPI